MMILCLSQNKTDKILIIAIDQNFQNSKALEKIWVIMRYRVLTFTKKVNNH